MFCCFSGTHIYYSSAYPGVLLTKNGCGRKYICQKDVM